MIWLLMAWLCAPDGECRPVEAPYATRAACLHAERVIKAQPIRLVAIHCRHRPAPATE